MAESPASAAATATPRVSIVTGAASGIGRATALLMARRGDRVVVSDVDARGGAETVAMIQAEGGEARWIPCDIAREEQVAALVDGTLAIWGRLDHAVNNAGIEGEQASTADCTRENWDRVIGVNLTGTWLCMRHEIAAMCTGSAAEVSGRTIVNVSSIAGLIGLTAIPAYCASKHGMNGLTRVAALELAPRGIRVNAVCPGAIRTPMIDRFTHEDDATAADLVARHPMGRMGEPEEIADVIAWLSSPASSFVTGQMLAADGGYVVA